MEKQAGEMPPPYQTQPGMGYGSPQAPPQYTQAPPQGGTQAQYPPPPPGQYPPPPPGYTTYQPAPGQPYQQYPNVIVHQPMVAPPAQGPPPPDHMTAAIFVTLCCFWPTGIIAIMKASEAKNAWIRGDAALAHTQSRSAKTMVTISIVAGICTVIMLAIFVGVYISILSSSLSYDDDY